MKKLFFALLLLPFLFSLSGCSDDEETPQPDLETYVKGTWAESKVTIKVTDLSGVTVSETESVGYGTYVLDGSNLSISFMPDFKWVYSIGQRNDEPFIAATYGQNFSLEYKIIVVSNQEMIWQRASTQPDANGQMNHVSVQNIYLNRK
ncbi:hypothetical protein [Rufibacter immobilis]|nr:hypothetical protein [Rufibacter immobilis]